MKKLILLVCILGTQAALHSQWIQTLNGTSIWSLAKDLSGNVYAGSLGSTSMIYKTTNYGMNWAGLASGNGQTIFSIAIDSMGNIFAANFSAGLLKSTNGGLNFTTMPASNFGGQGLNTVACGKRGHIYVGTNGAGFYRSIDTGNTFAPGGLSGLQVITITVDKYNSAFVYAGVTSTTSGPNGFYRSTDYGQNFSANLNPNKNIYGIIQKTPTDLYSISTTTGGPFDKSTDGGLNWVTINTGYVARGICDPGYTYIIIAGNNGVFFSSNNGSNFINYGITSSATPLVKQEGPGITYTGLSGSSNGGVWIRNDPLGINHIPEIAEEFSLSQNYPNPFNPTTKIKFQIPSNEFVSLNIFDALGREISTLVNEQLNSGTYEVEWDASSYPSGVYFYKLNTGSYTETKKMVLIK
jgi:hypothetical protein